MPQIDLSILNQRQTPAFYADVLANRPAAGFIGRIFVSTNTFEFYRDNGTGWDLIGGPGAGTITGSGATGQVTYWNGASTVTGDNGLFYDSVNDRLGIGTITPGAAIDAHSTQNIVLQLNQTTATNNTKIAFQNSGTAIWRIGNNYGGGTNSFVITDAALNINRFSVLRTSGQTFVGDVVTSSGLFVVNSNSGDAHIVALGATAPSIRVRNAGTGATLQFGLGLATTTNNFIQGSTGGEFCIFNDSLTAQPILFGIKDAGSGNTLEAARISAARNFLVGTVTDAGQKFQVSGTSFFIGSGGISMFLGDGTAIRGNATTNGNIFIDASRDLTGTLALRGNTINVSGTSPTTSLFNVATNATTFNCQAVTVINSGVSSFRLNNVTSSATWYFENNRNAPAGSLEITNSLTNPTITAFSTRNVAINSNVDAGFRLNVNGTTRLGDNVRLIGGCFISESGGGSSATRFLSNNVSGFNGFAFGNESTLNYSFEIRPTSGFSIAYGAFYATTASNSGNAPPPSPNASAVLQADSTTKGFLPPRMTTAQKNAIGTPATGLIVYDTTLNKLAVFTGVNWETVTSV